ncbi:MAG: hypothetical protein AB7H93_16540 [Vicinamibacterales bacterium]
MIDVLAAWLGVRALMDRMDAWRRRAAAAVPLVPRFFAVRDEWNVARPPRRRTFTGYWQARQIQKRLVIGAGPLPSYRPEVEHDG